MSPLRCVSDSSCLIKPRYGGCLAQQTHSGAPSSGQQRLWLDRIADFIAISVAVTAYGLDNTPFTERGGVAGAIRDHGSEAGRSPEPLNAKLTA